MTPEEEDMDKMQTKADAEYDQYKDRLAEDWDGALQEAFRN